MATRHASFHPDWQASPYWWEAMPPIPSYDDMPARTDVAIIGSGYAGLSAARILARHGMTVTVLEAREPGYGASTRNHGMVGGGLKIPADMDQTLGKARAARIRQNAHQSFTEFKQIIADERLDVDYSNSGRLTGAHTPAAYQKQIARGEDLRRNFGYHTRMLPREEQHSEIGSDFYYGALLVEESGGLHPAKLHRAYWRLAETAGAHIVGNAEVRAIEGRHGAFILRTSRGDLAADKVFVATNAYTGAITPALSPFVRNRVVPVTAYMATTEELPVDVANQILPTNRMCGDTKRSLFAFRLSPDRRRMIFAGRARWRDIDERAATPILHDFMSEVWPVLKDYRVTHGWKGLVCFTFDKLPHMGEIDGVYYAAGCQGSGVVMMSYLGRQVAEKIISGAEEQCGFDGLPFAGRPGYVGKPWFLPAIGGYYKTRDAIERSLVR
jgi:glycine/D-amino acid oxidase-like deaminating enzyme